MTFKPILMALLLVSLPAAMLRGQETREWKLEGTLNPGPVKLRLHIDLKSNDGKWSGTLTSLDQNNARLPLADIEVDETRLKFQVPMAGASYEGTRKDKDLPFSGNFSQGGNRLPLELAPRNQATADSPTPKSDEQKLVAAWSGKMNMGVARPIMQFRIVEDADGHQTAFFDSITEGATGFPAQWSSEDGTLRFEVESIRLIYEGKLNEAGDTADGTWTQAGRKFPLTLKRSSEPVNKEKSWQNRPQNPQAPFPYQSEEVTFENKDAGITLAGTLTIPKSGQPLPAVVLISGSGPQDRDETLMEHKPFLVLADYLSRHGIAVLRYDDRGTAASTGDHSKATTRDFATDAAAAVRFLKNHPAIDRTQIGLAGHSEGGLIGPLAAQIEPEVAFMVLLAATGVPGDEIIFSQTQAMMRAEGQDVAEMEIALQANRMVIEAAKDGKLKEGLTDELQANLQDLINQIPDEEERNTASEMLPKQVESQLKRLNGPWMQFFLSHDPRPELQKLTCPTLMLIGSKDVQVLPDLNVPEVRKALESSGTDDFKIVVLDDLNHLFQKCETGAMSEYFEIEETFNPVALQIIGDWITEKTKH